MHSSAVRSAPRSPQRGSPVTFNIMISRIRPSRTRMIAATTARAFAPRSSCQLTPVIASPIARDRERRSSPSRSVRASGTPAAESAARVDGCGWPYGLPAPTEIDGEARVGALEQGGQAGVLAAVVGDLEEVERAGVERRRLGLGVAGEQGVEAMPAGEQRRSSAGSGRLPGGGRPAPAGGQRTASRRAPLRSVVPGVERRVRAPAAAAIARRSRPAPAWTTCAVGIARRTAARPPAWSLWSWVMTTAARRSTPCAASSPAISVAGGPLSTRMGSPGAGSSRIASPWPTSRAVTVRCGAGCRRGRGPAARQRDEKGRDERARTVRASGRHGSAAPRSRARRASAAGGERARCEERGADPREGDRGSGRRPGPRPSPACRTSARPGRCRRRAASSASSAARPGSPGPGRGRRRACRATSPAPRPAARAGSPAARRARRSRNALRRSGRSPASRRR